MDIKNLLIVAGAGFLLLYGCGAQSVTQGVEVVQAGVSSVVSADPNATMNPLCLGAAQEQLTPYWAGMNTMQRFAMGLKVVTTCADGGGK